MKVGFVNIFGRPNAGKSTLLNALIGEKLAIVSPKVQTTRHRIKGILTTSDYQVILSDTPGIIEPKYKLHEKMMHAVKGSLEDADVAVLLLDVNDAWDTCDSIFASLRLSVPSIVAINKIDTAPKARQQEALAFFKTKTYASGVVLLSALSGGGVQDLMNAILLHLPEGEQFFAEEQLTDLSERFFVAELIREQIFFLFEEEIPYQATVLVTEFKEKSTLTKIAATIIVQRETQKAIILGQGGAMIKKIGMEARKEIENFIGRKVFLELFVKVRPKWRENELFLKEYGY